MLVFQVVHPPSNETKRVGDGLKTVAGVVFPLPKTKTSQPNQKNDGLGMCVFPFWLPFKSQIRPYFLEANFDGSFTWTCLFDVFQKILSQMVVV